MKCLSQMKQKMMVWTPLLLNNLPFTHQTIRKDGHIQKTLQNMDVTRSAKVQVSHLNFESVYSSGNLIPMLSYAYLMYFGNNSDWERVISN